MELFIEQQASNFSNLTYKNSRRYSSPAIFLTERTLHYIDNNKSLYKAGLLLAVFAFVSTLLSRRYVSGINFSSFVNFFNRWWLHVHDRTVMTIF